MTTYLSNRNGVGSLPSRTDEEGHYRFHTKVWSGNVVSIGDLVATQNSPLGMSILIGQGDFKIDDAIVGYSYTGYVKGFEEIEFDTPDVANPRIDCVIAYVDKQENTNPDPPNNPGIIKWKVVKGTPSTNPVTPTLAAMQDAAGAGNPFFNPYNVRIRSGQSTPQILTADIIDLRKFVSPNIDWATQRYSYYDGSSQTVTSGNYVKVPNLPSPVLRFMPGKNGKALITIGGYINSNSNSAGGRLSYGLSEGNVKAPENGWALGRPATNGIALRASRQFLHENLKQERTGIDLYAMADGGGTATVAEFFVFVDTY